MGLIGGSDPDSQAQTHDRTAVSKGHSRRQGGSGNRNSK